MDRVRLFTALSLASVCAPRALCADFGGNWRRIDPALSTGIAAAVSSSAAGDVTGDGRADVAFVIDEQVVFLDAPGSRESVVHTLIPAQRIHYLPPVGGSGLGGFAIVGLDGLQRLQWNPATPGFDVTTISNASRWVNAEFIDARANSNSRSIAGVATDHRTVTVIVEGGPDEGTWSFTMPTNVDALALVDWDSDAALEVALVVQGGLRVRDLDGTQIASYNHGTPGNAHLACVNGVGQIHEAVAWLRGTSGGQEIALVSSATPLSTMSLPSATPVADSLTAIDALAADELLPRDVDTDLLVGYADGSPARLFYNRSSEFSPGSSFVATDSISPGGDTYQRLRRPAVADFDNDGSEDIAFAEDVTQNSPFAWQVQLLVQGATTTTTTSGAVNSCNSCIGGNVFEGLTLVPGSTPVSDKLELKLRAAALAGDPSVTYDHLQVIVWKEVAGQPTSLEPISNHVYSLPSSIDSATLYLPQVALATSTVNTDGFSCDEGNRQDVYWVETRLIQGTLSSSIPPVGGTTWVFFLVGDCGNLAGRQTGQSGAMNLISATTGSYAVCPCESGTYRTCPDDPQDPPIACPSGAGTIIAGMHRIPDARMTGVTRRRTAPGGVVLTTPVTPAGVTNGGTVPVGTGN